MKTAAVFDIGSNTFVATVGRKSAAGPLQILLDESEVLRLSEGLQDGGPLQSAAKARVLGALIKFKKQAESLGATQFLAAGTAAFRRASDGKEFARQIGTELNIPTRILNGAEEATYSYRSACMDFEKDFGPLGMIDIGGGSTEFVFGKETSPFSLPIGTVRLTEKFVTGHPIADQEWKRIREQIRLELLALSVPSSLPRNWVAVAATPASLATVLLALPQFDPEKIQGFRLEKAGLEKLTEGLRRKNLNERIAMSGMHPQRAELLPVGGVILWEAMEFLKISDILVSDHGLRYGILEEIISQPTKISAETPKSDDIVS